MKRAFPFSVAALAIIGIWWMAVVTRIELKRPAPDGSKDDIVSQDRSAISTFAVEPDTQSESLPSAESPRFAWVSVRERMRQFEGAEITQIEEEFNARIINDPAFQREVFETFLSETDSNKQVFLQDVLASDAPLRNDPVWQGRFMDTAERDARTDRQHASLLFLQQAERLDEGIHERLVRLAEHGGPSAGRALLALEGLPGRREQDPALPALAARLAETEHDPEIRGIAIRIRADPERAHRALGDDNPYVRMQAARVATSRPALEQALQSETDPDARAVVERRLALLP